MSIVMEGQIKRSTARRKSTPVLEIIQGKTTIAVASRQFDILPAEPPRNPGRSNFGKVGPV